MSKNDERILALKEKIAQKKEQISQNSVRFNPITNCSIEFRGQRYNINTLNEEQCVLMLVELKALSNAARELKVELNFSGYSVDDWMEDLESKIYVLKEKSEERQLKAMESQLEKLLSEDKKTELEIDKIAQSLGL